MVVLVNHIGNVSQAVSIQVFTRIVSPIVSLNTIIPLACGINTVYLTGVVNEVVMKENIVY
jgi:hypothetical protein